MSLAPKSSRRGFPSKLLIGTFLGSAALLLSPAGLRAEEAAAEPTPEPESSIEVGGYVDTYYQYNFGGTDPLLRTFDVQHNTLSLSAAEVNLTKLPSQDSRLGFRTDLVFGKAADLTAAFEPADDGKEIYKHLQQAYVSLLTGKVQWDAGKFVTPIGAEVIESQDNWNYSRSILFGYAIPFYHVGLRASVPLSDQVTVAGYLTNGWNNASETNGDKTVGLSATVKPSDKVTWVANYMVGHEAPGDVEGRAVRNMFDTTLTLAATPKVSLMANVDYGKEGDASWWGIAGYAKVQATPSWSVAGRYEYVDDTDGGFMTIGTKAQSLTLTSDHLIAGALKARLEYRLDLADADIFSDSDGDAKDSQSSVSVGLVYTFGGKI